MVQEQLSLEDFFRSLAQKNDENNPQWGTEYREIVQRVKNESPDFSEQTIEDLWYTRMNGVASLRQGGMSYREFENGKKYLLDITKLIASGCTVGVYHQVQQRLQQLKTQGILRKFYKALCYRAFAALILLNSPV